MTRKQIELTKELAPPLFEFIEKVCKKHGMKIPSVTYANDAFYGSKTGLDGTIGAGFNLKNLSAINGNIHLSEESLNALGYGVEKFHAPLNNELKAVLAHELGHLKLNVGRMSFATVSPLIAAIATPIAWGLYKRYKHSNEPLEKAQEETSNISFPTIRKAVKYSLAALLGATATTALIRRPIYHAGEFQADHFAAMEVGADHLINGLEKLRAHTFNKTFAEDIKKGIIDQGKAEELVKWSDTITDLFAHPTHDKRVTRLQRYLPETSASLQI